MKLGSTLIIAFVLAWVIQFAMTYLQMRRFQKRLSELRKEGVTATGMSGSMYKRRVYAVLVIDQNEKILHAEQFSGWTVFAGLKPVKDLEGLTTNEIVDEEVKLPIPKKIRSAFQNAVEEIEKAKVKAAEKKEEPQKGIPIINSSGNLTDQY
jgi:DNA-binding transcriptional regulator of glucitol operon